MKFALHDDAVALRAGLREVLAEACPPAVVRAAWPGGDLAAVDRLWRTLGSFGLPGLLVAEGSGGLGLDELAMVAALEECGYAGTPGPVVETVAVGAPLLAASGPPGSTGLLADGLAGVLAGDGLAGVLADDGLAGVLAGASRVAVQPAPGAVVPYGLHSTLVLSLDASPELLRTAEAGVVAVDSVDGARWLAEVTGAGEALPVPAGAVGLARQRATVGCAAYLLGLARRQRDLTVDYVRDRRQFGVPVGSFQAVKHPLADATVATEFAWPAVLRAAHSLGQGDPQAAVHVSLAKALASDAAWQTSRACLQAHGAMGYTVEYDLHLYAKRTWAMAYDWGSAADHRALVAAHLGLDEGNTP